MKTAAVEHKPLVHTFATVTSRNPPVSPQICRSADITVVWVQRAEYANIYTITGKRGNGNLATAQKKVPTRTWYLFWGVLEAYVISFDVVICCGNNCNNGREGHTHSSSVLSSLFYPSNHTPICLL